MFFYKNGEVYRTLLHTENGMWAISYDHPLSPFFMDETYVERIETPADYVEQLQKSKTKAQQERYNLIAPLLEEESYISDEKARREKIVEIAQQTGNTAKRIRKLYFTYLATGSLTKPKPREKKKHPDYDWAIRTYYFSSKRHSLKTTYDLMILSRYTNTSGEIAETIPSWSSFKHYYDRNHKKWEKQKTISREGLSKYKRDHRMAYGSAMQWREKIGSLQMDATQADVYLVSEYDRSETIGRPTIIFAVDTATQLVAGIYVGMEGNEAAVLSCLANVAADKAEYCRQFGIELEERQWPCSGVMAHELITDQGREFRGSRMDDFLLHYGMEAQVLPPFRPDEKGLVEKSFDLLQDCYKPLLRGKGTIEEDAAERWATDYRNQAVLTLNEFTAIVIRAVIYLNSGRTVQDSFTPASLWQKLLSEGKSNLLCVDAEDVYRAALPRTKAKLTRKGIFFNRLHYAPERIDGLAVGDNVQIAYNPQNIDTVFLLQKGVFVPCSLTETCRKYSGYNTSELKTAMSEKAKKIRNRNQEETQARIAMRKEILQMILCAEGKKDA